MISPAFDIPLPMGLVKPNSFLAHVRGRIGDLGIVKHYGDKIVFTKLPTFTKPRAKGQKLNSNHFAKASDYAKHIQRNPEKLKTYEAWAKRLNRTIRSVAMSDFLTLPRLQHIGLRNFNGEPGRRISITALKRFKVTGVFVVIRDINGKVIENGEAVTNDKTRAHWTYPGKKSLAGLGIVIVEATATDRFGRTTSTSADKTF
jgi:hypothetical protein